MKRSPGSANFGCGSAKRYASSRKPSHMSMLKQYHQQGQHSQQHQHQKPQQQRYHHPSMGSTMATNQQYYSPRPNKMQGSCGMIPFQNPNNNPPNNFHYNGLSNMHPHIWKYNVSPSSAAAPLGYEVSTQPPLPLEPPKQPAPPPLPPPEREPPGVLGSLQSKVMQMNSYQMGIPLNTYSCDVSASPDLKTFVRKKHKRKSISTRVGCFREWNREDALKAIALEKQYAKKERSQILLLRFPDPELSREIVSGYSTQIESVHFQQNTAPRSCYVHLKEGADAEKVIETVSSIPFGTGFVTAQLKRTLGVDAAPIVNPEDVDPYTLYIGNLPTTVSSRTVKEHFPNAHRIDIGFAQRLKHTRYAFVRYQSFEEALEAFRSSINTLIDSRSLIVRFRRQRGENKMLLPPAAGENQMRGVANAQREQSEKEPIPEKEATSTPEEETQLLSVSTIATNQTAVKEPANQPEVTLSGNSEADSIQSRAESENVSFDSKANVLSEAQRLQRNHLISEAPGENASASQRRCSMEEMFKMLDQKELTSNASEKVVEKVRIKEEVPHCDDVSDNEDPMSLLGARYKEGEANIKTEDYWSPSPENSGNEIYNADSDFDEEFGMDAVEEDESEILWPTPQAVCTENINSDVNSKRNSCTTTASFIKFVDIAKEDPDDVIDEKPSIEQLNPDEAVENNYNNNRINNYSFPFPARSTEMERLYEQQRKFRQREQRKRPRDELDEMFARMDSDEEDDFL